MEPHDTGTQWMALRAAAISLVLALPGCSEPTAPAPTTGFYLLTSANGSPPPVLVEATPACDQRLNKTSLILAADGTFGLAAQAVSDCTRSGGSVTMTIENFSGTYRASGARLTLIPSAPGSPSIMATYDATHIRGTIPASPQTFPIDLNATFLFYPAPPP